MNCFVAHKTVVVGYSFLLAEFVVTTLDESSPQNFWKLNNITINEPKNMQLKQINVQQSVLNADAKSAFYNLTTFNRVRIC